MGKQVRNGDQTSLSAERTARRRAIFRLAVLAVLVAASIFVAYIGLASFPADIEFSVEAITDWVNSLGARGRLAVIVLMIIHSFVPFPSELVALAAGMSFGIFWGSVLTWTGAMLGALVSFALVRLLGRPFVNVMLPLAQRNKLDSWTDIHGASTLLAVRLIPVIAFNLVNYAAALTPVTWRTFIITTGIGITPLTILMVSLGASAHHLTWPQWLALTCAGTALWLGVVFVRARITKRDGSDKNNR